MSDPVQVASLDRGARGFSTQLVTHKITWGHGDVEPAAARAPSPPEATDEHRGSTGTASWCRRGAARQGLFAVPALVASDEFRLRRESF